MLVFLYFITFFSNSRNQFLYIILISCTKKVDMVISG